MTGGEVKEIERFESELFFELINVKKYFAQTSILSIFQHYFLLSPSSHLDT